MQRYGPAKTEWFSARKIELFCADDDNLKVMNRKPMGKVSRLRLC